MLAFVFALANLSFLNVLMGLWTFLLLFYLSKNLMRQRQRPVDSPKEHGGAWSRLALAAVALSIPFNLIVIGQCLRLSERSTDPVLVRVHGLQAEEHGSILVLGTEFYGNEIPLTLRNGAWVPPRTIYLKRLKLGISRATLGRLGEVEIDIGARRLRFSRQAIRDWRHLGEGDFRYFLFDPPAAKSLFRDMSGVVNWRGDAVFFGAFAQEAALVVVGLALLLGLIYGLGRLAVRLKLLQADEIRPLWVSAGLAILYLLYPIYALNRNQALYYGGNGFIKDTVYSLIRDSFYGRQYAAVQERIVFWFMLCAAALAVLWSGRRLHKKDLAEQPETFSILAVMAIISLLDIAQGALFGIPLLLGRTAIFFIPLAGLFLLFLLRDLWLLGGAWRAGAAVVLITIVGLSSYHWVRTANLTHTLDWSFDADTKTMIYDVTLLRAQAPSDPTRVRLGLEWQFWPSSVYYRKRNHLPWLDVYMLPTPWNCDIYYLTGDDPRIESLTVLKRYPLTGNVLAR